jgi:von Willebrand factor type A domain
MSVFHLQYTSANGDRAGVNNVVIYVSDGYSDSPAGNAAQQLRNAGVTIYTVGLTDSPNQSELASIASSPSNSYSFNLDSTHSYAATATSLLNAIC